MDEAGFDFEIREPNAEEVHEGDPARIVVSNAVGKACSVERDDDDIIIGADTLVVCNGKTLGKPAGAVEAERMIRLQMKHPQDVLTGLCVIHSDSGRTITGYEVSRVRMIGDEAALKHHIESGQWMGKAGAYGIQDKGPIKIEVISGNKDNVVGLPLILLRRMLSMVGFDYPERTPSDCQ
jgi:septum formation protein